MSWYLVGDKDRFLLRHIGVWTSFFISASQSVSVCAAAAGVSAFLGAHTNARRSHLGNPLNGIAR